MIEFFGFVFTTLMFALIVSCVVSSVHIVREQTVGIVETFGKFSQTLTPGLSLTLPWPISTVVKRLDLRILEISNSIGIKTKDNMFVEIPVNTMIQIQAEQAENAYYKLRDPAKQIERWVLNTIRAQAAGMNIEQLFTDRSAIIDEVSKELAEKLNSFGYRVEAVLIDQPKVDETVQKAFNRVVTARREAEAATQEGEAKRIKIVAEAKAEAEAQSERAMGLSKARKIIAESFVESIKLFDGTNADPNQAMDLLFGVNRLDAMRDIGSHGNMVIVDMNNNVSKDAIQLALLKKNGGKA
jgi:regulator of protease activity HflC (stomatin/prohibitin superfamily)